MVMKRTRQKTLEERASRGAAGVEALVASLDVAHHTSELKGTPARVERLYRERLTAGYAVDVRLMLAQAALRSRARAVVALHDLPVATTCPHHLMPAWGSATVAFQPDGKLLGIGVVAEAVRALAQRLVLQEELSESIVEAISRAISPTWVTCRLRMVHGCMVASSPTAEQIVVETSALRGRVPTSSEHRSPT
jgi:GTP cyclohydrolase I